jgi:hypothetical protein
MAGPVEEEIDGMLRGKSRRELDRMIDGVVEKLRKGIAWFFVYWFYFFIITIVAWLTVFTF